jgi:hypothetical protein
VHQDDAALAFAAVVIYRGARRRRIRRLVRSRVFNNARTATRNLDLPLAIGDPIATRLFLLHRRILASAWRPQRWAFSGIRRLPAALFCALNLNAPSAKCVWKLPGSRFAVPRIWQASRHG